MLINNYLKNSPAQIIRLKKDLMSKTRRTNSRSSFSSEYFKNRNAEISIIFEENIRNTLSFEFGWKNSDFDRYFHYRKVKFNIKEHILLREGEISFKFKNKVYFLISNDDQIILKKGEKLIKQLPNKYSKELEFTIRGMKILIQKEKEVEIDGDDNIRDFDFAPFDDYFSVLYRNVDNDELGNFNTSLIEVKLNRKKIPDLISQIKEDNEIYEKITNDNILYIGFVGYSGKSGINYDFESELSNINCIILELKSFFIKGRDMRKPFDWGLIKIVEELKNEVNEIKNEVDEIKNEVNEIKNDLKIIKNILLKDNNSSNE